MKRFLFVLIPLLLVASCAGGTKRDDKSGHNDADIAFVQQMLAHHRQAIEMTTFADDARPSVEVDEFADGVEAAQLPEIDQMKQWLDEWGVADEGAGHGHGDGDVTGMMSAADMTDLESSSGPEFSGMWLQMMIEHHTGAISMAREVLDEGESADVRELARAIVSTQQQEIDEMAEAL